MNLAPPHPYPPNTPTPHTPLPPPTPLPLQAEAWRPWLSGPQQQVGGWVIEYDLPPPTPQPTHTAGAAAQRGAKGAAQAQQQQGGAGAAQRREGRVAVGDGAPQGRLVFASVRGAGHMVPYTQPQRALHLLVHFLRGWPL